MVSAITLKWLSAIAEMRSSGKLGARLTKHICRGHRTIRDFVIGDPGPIC
jgi:hypothetical protein